jgi:hypothetical protein
VRCSLRVSGLFAGSDAWGLPFTTRPGPPTLRDRGVVLHVSYRGDRPSDFTDVPLEPLLWHRARQRRAPSIDADFDIIRPRQQIERVGDEVFDFVIVVRPERLAAPHGDRREKPAGCDANRNSDPVSAGTPVGSGLDAMAGNPALTLGPATTGMIPPANAYGSTCMRFEGGTPLKGPPGAGPWAGRPDDIVPNGRWAEGIGV